MTHSVFIPHVLRLVLWIAAFIHSLYPLSCCIYNLEERNQLLKVLDLMTQSSFLLNFYLLQGKAVIFSDVVSHILWHTRWWGPPHSAWTHDREVFFWMLPGILTIPLAPFLGRVWGFHAHRVVLLLAIVSISSSITSPRGVLYLWERKRLPDKSCTQPVKKYQSQNRPIVTKQITIHDYNTKCLY